MRRPRVQEQDWRRRRPAVGVRSNWTRESGGLAGGGWLAAKAGPETRSKLARPRPGAQRSNYNLARWGSSRPKSSAQQVSASKSPGCLGSRIRQPAWRTTVLHLWWAALLFFAYLVGKCASSAGTWRCTRWASSRGFSAFRGASGGAVQLQMCASQSLAWGTQMRAGAGWQRSQCHCTKRRRIGRDARPSWPAHKQACWPT